MHEDIRPYVPLEIHWKTKNVLHVRAFIDTGAEATLLYGNPAKFKGERLTVMGIGGKPIQAVATWVKLKIGHLSTREYEVLITPIKEWIIGMGILRGMTLHLDNGCFKFGGMIQARPVLVGRVKMPPFPITLANKVVHMKQYRIPGCHQEITDTVKDYITAGVLKPVITQWNNPIWPLNKSGGSWRMTVDYRVSNKHTPPLTSPIPDTI